MKKIKVLFFNFFCQLIREKILITLFLIALSFLLVTLILNEMVVGEKAKATRDLSLSILNLFLLFYVLFVFITGLKRELRERSFYFHFTRTVSRQFYLFSFYSAQLTALTIGLLAVTATAQLLLLFQNQFWLLPLLQAVYFNLLEGALLLAIACLFSLLTTTQLALFLTIGIYFAGHTIQQATLIVTPEKNQLVAGLLKLFYLFIPDLEIFNRTVEISYQFPLTLNNFLIPLLYSLCWILLLLFLSSRLFSKMEL